MPVPLHLRCLCFYSCPHLFLCIITIVPHISPPVIDVTVGGYYYLTFYVTFHTKLKWTEGPRKFWIHVYYRNMFLKIIQTLILLWSIQNDSNSMKPISPWPIIFICIFIGQIVFSLKLILNNDMVSHYTEILHFSIAALRVRKGSSICLAGWLKHTPKVTHNE